MADFRGFIANCLIGGEEITRRGEERTRDTVRLNCGGFQFELRQKREIIVEPPSRFKDRFVHTTDIFVRNIKQGQIPKLKKVLNQVCWLLSFAGLSRVIYFGHEYPDGTGRCYQWSVVGVSSFSRPTFDIRDGGKVRNFIDQVYNTYSRLETKRRLNVVIDYLIQAERSGQPRELKLILAFIVLESLKDTYARERGIPYINGHFRKGPRPSSRSPVYSFKELLQEMLRAVGMRRGIKRIIQLRNEIIHSGVLRLLPSSQWSLYRRAYDIISEYLLRLLGYHGPYLKYTSPSGQSREL
jgi:hypothetical protein